VKISLAELADFTSGKILRGDPAQVYCGFAALDVASEDDIGFFGNARYADQLAATHAGALLIPEGEAESQAPDSAALVAVENPVIAFDLVVRRFGVARPDFVAGVHPSAVLGDGVTLDAEKVSIAAHVVIGSGSSIGDGTRIGPGTSVGEGVRIGSDCEISANVSIREGSVLGDRVILHGGVVIGADGYGFEHIDGRHQKIEQLGIVRIDDDVEVGANTTIDRARFGETVIGEGTKIDNQVQIGHNVKIGRHCLIVAQVGIAGSTVVGDYVTLAARAGIGGHLKLGDKSTVGGKAGLISDLPAGETWFGYPARPMKEDLRAQMRLKQLGRFFQKVKDLEARILELEGDDQS
jgi:UDP-3-O-[3-hydroxymyristoyl] glucosamine N-acyltransferase